MAENTKIQWARHTANLWWGCVEIANNPGCDECYARELDKRYGGDHWGARSPRRAIKSVWGNLNRFQDAAAAAGEMHRVFVGSMMDIFERSQPLVDHEGNPIPDLETKDLRNRLFEECIPSMPNLLFLLLTKRPANITRMVPGDWLENPPKNVMYGCSVSDQESADRFIPDLLEAPGKRFLSVEPLLGPVDIDEAMYGNDERGMNAFGFTDGVGHEAMLQWIIVGGESGPNARPMDLAWARDIIRQCRTAEVPVFMKQLGARPMLGPGDTFKLNPIQITDPKGGDPAEWPEDLRIREFPESPLEEIQPSLL